jgi:hypothetical protein
VTGNKVFSNGGLTVAQPTGITIWVKLKIVYVCERGIVNDAGTPLPNTPTPPPPIGCTPTVSIAYHERVG